MQHSTRYILGFAAAVCLVCAVVVAGAAVSLRDAQEANRALDLQKKVLSVAGLLEPEQRVSDDDIRKLYKQAVEPRRVELATGEVSPQEAAPAAADPSGTEDRQRAPKNEAGIVQMPTHAEVYLVRPKEGPSVLVLPVEGKGLWSTMYGLLALDAGDLGTIRGVEFYEHGETPGLGGEIDNPRWKAGWEGRKAFDESGEPAIRVARGAAGPAREDPYRVDALTGATITAQGVTHLMQFWLGEHGYGPHLAQLREASGGGDHE